MSNTDMRSRGWVLVLAGIVSLFSSQCAGQWVDAFNPAPDSTVGALVVQPDGKVLMAGSFGKIGKERRPLLARVNRDGSLDTGFAPQIGDADGAAASVSSLALQGDGRILLGGRFGSLGGQPRYGIGRLNPDGSLDTTFDPDTIGSRFTDSILVQNDGKIVVGGEFTVKGDETNAHLARLNTDGSLDKTFLGTVSRDGLTPHVIALLVQSDGKILLGGNFTELNGQPRTSLGRLNPDGSLDFAFNPQFGNNPVRVYALACQPDGKILVGGRFSVLGKEYRGNLCRLNPDGTLDSSFSSSPDGHDPSVRCLAVQADGKILVGGGFNWLGPVRCGHLGRLNQDGSFAESLYADADVLCMARPSDGTLVVGGSFWHLGGESRSYIGRLGPVDLRPSLAGPHVHSDTLHLNWQCVSNGVYKIQFKTNLLQQNWVDLMGEFVANDKNIFVALPATNTQGFFRAVYQR